MSAVPVMSSVHVTMICVRPVTQIWQKSMQNIFITKLTVHINNRLSY